MEQALALYEKIGDRYSTARCQFYLGLLLQEKGEAERARSLLLAARATWAAIQFEAGVTLIDEHLEQEQ